MGETDEKENVPVEPPTVEIEEPKETEKLLNTDEKKSELGSPIDHKLDIESVCEEIKPSKESAEKVNGDEVIVIPESTEPEKKVKGEGREVKPRKIPIGGIKMPGFFTKKSKAVEKDGAEGELLENAGNEAKLNGEAEEENPAPANPKKRFLSSVKMPELPKVHFPFGFKKASPPKDVEAGDENAKEKPEEKTETAEEEKPAVEEKVSEQEEKPEKEPLNDTKGENEQAPPATKLNFSKYLPRLPKLNISLDASIKRFRSNNTQTDDLEMGNGPNNKAGLASMETLDDSTKDNEANKDVTDKAALPDDGLETVKLNENEKEKEAGKEKDNGKIGDTDVNKQPIIDRIRSYRWSIDDLAIIGGIMVFLLLVAIICLFTFSLSPAALTASPIIDGKFIRAITSCGEVEGVVEDSSYAFRGIPYAVPPIGKRRFKPAEPIENINKCWNGTLKAHNATDICPQILSNGDIKGEEDCLHLDVITPYVRYTNPLPVVVLIGADSLNGESPNKLLPSARYARDRDVIFVRPNFRVGLLGFLALESLSKSVRPPTSGNYALSDILVALRWIQLNIVHFGGSPDMVTLVGHRAGATIVSALITSPEAKGLFARAWVSSGAASFPGLRLSEYERANKIYENQLKEKCSEDNCLGTKEADELLEAVPDTWRKVWPDLPSIDENTTARHEWLVLDGKILQKSPVDVWNSVANVSPPHLVIGTTAHESHSEKLLKKHANWTPELVRAHIQQSQIGQMGLTDEALKRYNATYKGLVQMISDIRTVCPLLLNARLQPSVPFYVVTQTSGDLDIADVDSDIQAILGRFEPKTSQHRKYVSAIQQLFYYYVSHGEVRQFDARKRVLKFGQDALSYEDYPNCDFWTKKDIVPRYARLD